MFSIICSSQSTRRETKRCASVDTTTGAATAAHVLLFLITLLAFAQPGLAARRQVLPAAQAVAFAPTGVFNSLEFQTNATTGISNWRNAIKRIANERATYEDCDQEATACPAQLRTWRDHLKSWKGLSAKARLIQVNRWANAAFRYTDDRATFQTADYWASPAQSLMGRGDCEDYALLKYESLKALGFAEDALRIVVVNDLRRGIGHAVLSVKTDMGTFILDNQDNRVMRHDSITRYAPLFSINANGRWINIATRSLKKTKPAVTLVASAEELGEIETAAAAMEPTKALPVYKPRLKPALPLMASLNDLPPPQRLSATAAMAKAKSSVLAMETPVLPQHGIARRFLALLEPLGTILRPTIWG